MTDQLPEVDRLPSMLEEALATLHQHAEWYPALQPVESALVAEIERLQIALRGIQSCGTCGMCIGAATRALQSAGAGGSNGNVTPVPTDQSGVAEGDTSAACQSHEPAADRGFERVAIRDDETWPFSPIWKIGGVQFVEFDVAIEAIRKAERAAQPPRDGA